MPKKKKAEYKSPEETPGFALNVSITIVVSFAVVVFLVVWLFFYANAFDVYQNLAVVLAAVLVFICVMGAAWAHWGIKYGKKFDKCGKK